jgi:hypothetical protein
MEKKLETFTQAKGTADEKAAVNPRSPKKDTPCHLLKMFSL